VRAWVDIDNPPQARYLLPVARRFERAGHDVLLTARAHGDTFAILRSEGAPFEAVGMSFGKGLGRKLVGLSKRTRLLTDFIGGQSKAVDFVLTGSRAAALTARTLGIPSFIIVDYEYVNLLVYELAGSHVLHPDVISPRVFRRRGVRLKNLFPFEGLKEGISFADSDLASIRPYELAESDRTHARILFRPPAEDSHYYRSETGNLAMEVLARLAVSGAQVVFSPRTRTQIGDLERVRDWQRDPIILREPVPFVSLLKAVDGVVSAGGTMIREAAYLGVPAYSIFRGRLGAVDRYLASIGRLTLLSSASEVSRLELRRTDSIKPLQSSPDPAQAVADIVVDRVRTAAPPQAA
jgi:predicted glycosyltransferase